MKSAFSPKNTTLTKAVKTSPTPAQMAYAVASGMVFSVIDKAQKHTEKLTTTPIEGHSLLNPPLSLSMEEPQTSLKIATVRKSQCICMFLPDK